MAQKSEHNFFIFADEIREQITEDYTDAEIGQLFRAMLDYSIDDAEPSFEDRGLRTFWRTLKGQIDRQREHRAEKSDKNKNNQYDRWLKQWFDSGDGQRLYKFLTEHPDFDLEDWLLRHEEVDEYDTDVYVSIQTYRFEYEFENRIPSIPILSLPNQNQKHTSKDVCKNIQIRRAEFDVYVFECYRGTYNVEMLAQFCRKWTETCTDRRKMRFEITKNYDIEKSLQNWDEHLSRREFANLPRRKDPIQILKNINN